MYKPQTNHARIAAYGQATFMAMNAIIFGLEEDAQTVIFTGAMRAERPKLRTFEKEEIEVGVVVKDPGGVRSAVRTIF